MLGFGSKSGRGQTRKRLGDLLVESERLHPDDLKKALAQQRRDGGLLGRILVENKMIEQDTLLAFVMKLSDPAALSLADYNINEQAVSQIPEDICAQYGVLPIDKLGRILTLAMIDPLDTAALEKVREQCPDLRIRPMLCRWEDFSAVFSRIYGKTLEKPGDLETRYLHLDASALTASGAQTADVTTPDEPADTTADDEERFESPDRDESSGEADDLSLAVSDAYGGGTVRLSAEEITAGIQEMAKAIRESISEAMAGFAEAARTTGEPDPAEREQAELWLEAMQQTLESALGAFSDELREEREVLQAKLSALRDEKSEGSSVSELAETMERQLSERTQQWLDVLSSQMGEMGAAIQQLATEKTSEASPTELVENLREAIQESTRTSAATMTESLERLLSRQDTDTIDPMQAAELIRDGVGAVLGNALEAISGQIQQLAETHQNQIAALPAPPDVQSIVQSFHEQLTGGLDARLGVLADQLRAHLQQGSTSSGTHIEQLARTIREAILAAVEANKTIQAEQQRHLAQTVETSLNAIAANRDNERKGLADIAEAILHSIKHEKSSQAEKQAQLGEIAQAALESVRQTAQLIEVHTVAENTRQDLMRRSKARHASVTSFNPAGAVNPEDYAEEDKRVRDSLDSERPPSSLTFDNFFPGDVNGFAVNIAKAVAASPGGEYNPLFLYGPVGLGKTHLISAIGNEIIAKSQRDKQTPSARVGYISASHFSRRLTAALADDAVELFRDNYCQWDLLLLDDIQFLGGRVEAQEEFFHIFNVLLQAGRQLVIAADKAPDKLGLLEQRLVSRFASGIVVEVKPPEWETRMKILRELALNAKSKVPEDILSLIALQVTDDIRKMIGALRKIIAYMRLQGEKITMEEAQSILNHL